MDKTVLMLGTFDSKAEEFAFLRQRILELGGTVLAMDVGVLGTTAPFPIDIEAERVVKTAGETLTSLRERNDRGFAMQAMARGAARLVPQLFAEGRFDGAIGMGGSGGASVIAAALRALPLGVPKVCVSTVAGGDVSAYVGTKDVVMIPSIADVAGVNRITRVIYTRAAGAIVGMVNAAPELAADDRPVIVASMFGNTTACVDGCRRRLEQQGYETLVFHATGAGGRTMESLIDEGLVDGCLDVTTTEWADELCGGVFAAGDDRLSAPGRNGVAHLIAPGCVDMVNFGPPETVPAPYVEAGRNFNQWNANVTLMRTNADENRRLGEIFARKANAAEAPVAFLLPLRGVSLLDGDGQPFCDREADEALFAALRKNIDNRIRVETIDCNINDAPFVERAVQLLTELMASSVASTSP